MPDEVSAAAPVQRCNWCSAPLPSDHEITCPSCGATLLGAGETSVPGLTAIDAEAILRNARAGKAKPRSRLLGWISGDYDESAAGSTASPGSLDPPSGDVRREMLRLELEAQVANAQAEVESLAADAALEEGRSLAPAETAEAAVAVDAEAALATAPATASAAAAPVDAAGPPPEPAGMHTEDEAPPA